MVLRVGEQAPEFEVSAIVEGKPKKLRLSDYRGQKCVVLYFYPRDFTPVCTQEACGFRDDYALLVAKDAEVIGVSVDDDDSHIRFAQRFDVPFPLVSDRDRTLARAYGATSLLRDLMRSTKRVTYVIDKQGRIAAVFQSELFANQHVDGVRAAIERLRKGA